MLKKSFVLYLVFIWVASLFSGFPIQISLADSLISHPLPITNISLSNDKVIKTEQLSFEWSLDQLSWSVCPEGIQATLDDLAPLYIPGKPVLPYKTFQHKLKPDERVVSIKTIHIDYIALPDLKFPVYMAPEPQTIHQRKDLNPNKPLMQNDTIVFFPEQNFEFNHLSVNEKQVLNLFVFPMYIIRGKWYLLTDLVIEIAVSQKTDQHYGKIASTKSPQDTAIILCPDELFSAANALKKIQESDGYHVTVFRLSELSSYKGTDLPTLRGVRGYADLPESERLRFRNYNFNLASKIRTFLKQKKEAGQIDYLTILGDASYVPPSYYIYSNDGFGDYDQWVPTDYFYMSPYASESTYTFDINVGRIPVRNLQEAQDAVAKIAKYRSNLDLSWFKNAALMGGDTFNGDYFAELAMTKAINQDYLKGLNIQKYWKTEGKFETNSVLDGFRQAEKGFIWAFGHGSGDGLALEPGFLSSKQLMDLPENKHLPIVVSEACGNGAWDSRLANAEFETNSEHPYPTSFSEAVVLSKGAGIAYVGGARINYAGWNLSYENGVPNLKRVYYMDAIIEYFFKQYTEEGGSLGDIVRRSMKEYMEEEWYWINAPQIKTFFGFTLQGDPTIRLPQAAKLSGKQFTPPVLTYEESMPLSLGKLPYFSMDQGVNIKAKSDSQELEYIVSDYLDHESPIRFQGSIKATSYQSFKHYFKPDKKSKMTIRIQTRDFKESRIVFYSRYNYDLVVYANNDLTLLQKNEVKDYSFTLANEGIYDANHLEVKVDALGETIKSYQVPHIPMMTSKRFFFTYQSDTTGDHELTIKAPSLKNETITDDNHISYPLRIVDDYVTRIGVLHSSNVNSRDYYEQRLMIKEVNEHYRKMNQNIEICVIPFAFDSMKASSMDRLNIDMMVLYTPYFYNFPSQEALAYLEDFESRGGSVLGILSLGLNQFSFPLIDVQEYFGIFRNHEFSMKQNKDYEQNFDIKDDPWNIFSKQRYQIPSRFSLYSDQTWDQIIQKDVKILGLSEDRHLALLQHGSRFLYSGFLSEKDFEDPSGDALIFFTELLALASRQRVDAGIRTMYFEETQDTENDISSLTVEYQNMGNVSIENLQLVLNKNQVFDLGTLNAREHGSYSLVIPKKQHQEYQDYDVELKVAEDIVDCNPKNNSRSIRRYDASLSDDVEVPSLVLEGALERSTLMDQETIKGKVTPGAYLEVNKQVFSANSDGSFAIVLPLNHGLQTYELVATQGKLRSKESLLLHINRQKEILINLIIDDPVIFLNHKPSSPLALDAPPFIHNSVTYVPVRFIAEAFGAEVMYIPDTRTVQMKYQDITIEMKYLELFATVTSPEGSKRIPLQGPYIIRHGRSFVPIRFIAEVFGAKVDWNATLEMVTLIHRSNIGKVTPPEIKYAEEIMPEQHFYSTIVHGDNQGMLINPTCMDEMEDGSLMISAYDGLYRWDFEKDPEKIINLQEWKSKYFDTYYFDQSNSFVNQAVFRSWGDKLIFSDRYDIYIIDPQSNQLIRTIFYANYGTLLYPVLNYPVIWTMEVQGDDLYLLNPYLGITVVNLPTGEIVQQHRMPNYPIDFTLRANKITAFCLFGDMLSLDLVSGKIISYESDEMVFAGSITQHENHYYLQTLIPNSIRKVSLNADGTINLVQTYRLSSIASVFVEQIVINKSGIFALIYDLETMHSGLARLNDRMAITWDNLKSTREWLKKQEQFELFAHRTWLVDDQNMLLSFRSPGKTNTLHLFSPDGNLIKEIPVRLESRYVDIMDIQYLGDHVIAVLLYNRQFQVQFINFENLRRLRYSTVELLPEDDDFYPYYWAVDHERACFWDYYSADYFVFNLADGKQLQRFSSHQTDLQPSYLSTNRFMRYHNEYLYIFDAEKFFIRVFDVNGKFFTQWNLEHLKRGLPIFISDFKIIDHDHFAFLDYDHSRVVQVKNGAMIDSWGYRTVSDFSDNPDESFLGPLCVDFYQNYMLINDAGNFRVIVVNFSEERDQKPSIKIFPSAISKTLSHPLDWNFQMHIQRFDDISPFEITHPKGLTYVIIHQGDSNLLILWSLDQEYLSKNAIITGDILFQSSKLALSVDVSIERKPVVLTIYSHLIIKGEQSVIPYLASRFDKEFLMIETETLADILNFEHKLFENDIIITCMDKVFIFQEGSHEGRLMDHLGTQLFSLGASVKKHKGRYLLPVNVFLKMLSIEHKIMDNKAEIILCLNTPQ